MVSVNTSRKRQCDKIHVAMQTLTLVVEDEGEEEEELLEHLGPAELS